MKAKTIALFAALAFSLTFAGPALAGNPTVIIKTSMGTIEAELFKDKSPISVDNFLKYVQDKFFDRTVFHRVIPNFMIQGGGMDANLAKKKTRAQIKNEAGNGLKNLRGTLAMARTNMVDSATAQFFINLKDNKFLDHGARGFGYAVFGKVTKGLNVVDEIAAVKTGRKGPFSQNCPLENVVIESIRVKK